MNNKIREYQDKFVMKTYAPNLLLVKGVGSVVIDDENKQYLDFTAGISVCNVGHCHSKVTAAISKQAQELVHTSNLFINEQQPVLAQKLVSKGFDGVVFFANSGAEANEGLIKFARKWGSDKGKYEIITMHDSFHGRTLATLAATGRSQYRQGFAPDMPGFKHAYFNDIESIKSQVTDKTAAILLEPVQGEGGIIPADREFLQQVRALCDEKDILLLFDEVQCGMGRLGTFYAYQSFGVEPDAVSLAKALGNGFPIGAFVVQRKHENVLQAGTHASTFGGTPLACAAANAVIDVIDEENLLENCQKMSKIIFERFNDFVKKFPFVETVRGKGLMCGIKLDRPAAFLMQPLREKGLLALTAGESVLRLLPALNISEAEVESALNIIEEVLSEVEV
ncbi:aspartate aminotransferase family protein [Lentisphaerota bacterium WC36G]|nr:aspartate aminotransferase family protein [Lentisphaerae bacterium WC36]